MVDGSNDVALMSQRTGQPDLIAPVAAIAVRQHHQGMFPCSRRRVANGAGAGKHDIVGNQLWRVGCRARVPHDQLQWALMVRVGQGGGLEADLLDVSQSTG